MASEAQLFIESVHRATGQIPVWIPGRKVSLGEIGIFDRSGEWVQMTSLEDQGIPFEPQTDDSPTYKLSLGSGQKWSVAVNGHGGTTATPGVPKVNAELKLALAGSGSFALEAYGTRVHVITNLVDVEREVLSRVGAGGNRWDDKWCVVTQLLEAGRSFVAVSSGSSSAVNLNLGVDPTGPFLDLAHLSAGVAVTRQSNTAVASIATEPTALSFKFRKVGYSFLNGPKFQLDAPKALLEGTPEDIDWNGAS